jgi:hypothetical protein
MKQGITIRISGKRYKLEIGRKKKNPDIKNSQLSCTRETASKRHIYNVIITSKFSQQNVSTIFL